jgi:serine/threonine protein kinase
VVPGLTDLEVFARGGYATVYRAVQQSVGREVAVKVENRTLDSERDQTRFLREARAAGRMSSHPHVVDLFDVGVTADQHPYLIMELCDGSYAERMRRDPLRPAEVRDLGVKIADALAHSHAAGVLHRDVKPANILHSQFNSAVLADFGLAVLAEVRDSSVTLEVLTPAYAPPEMFRHHPPSPAVDVYALCATLYALMSGKPPRWQDDQNPSLLTLMELFTQPIPDLPGVPVPLLELLRHGMSNEPGDRPSAEQLRDLLASVPLVTPRARTTIPLSGRTAAIGTAAPVVRPIADAPTSELPTTGSSRRANAPVAGPAAQAGPLASANAPPKVYLSSSYVPPKLRSAGQVGETTEETPPAATGSRRRRVWFLGGLGALALLVAVWVGVGYPGRWEGLTPGKSTASGATTSHPIDPTVTGTGAAPTRAGALPGCLLPLPRAVRCPAELECFGPVVIRGGAARASRVSCAGRHTWESYAEGDLPAEVDAANHGAVRDDPTVGQICTPRIFQLTTGLLSVEDWNFEVLPPSPEGTETMDRTFRCLAGRGLHGLVGPVLTR